jgi:hypothetical protein
MGEAMEHNKEDRKKFLSYTGERIHVAIRTYTDYDTDNGL